MGKSFYDFGIKVNGKWQEFIKDGSGNPYYAASQNGSVCYYSPEFYTPNNFWSDWNSQQYSNPDIGLNTKYRDLTTTSSMVNFGNYVCNVMYVNNSPTTNVTDGTYFLAQASNASDNYYYFKVWFDPSASSGQYIKYSCRMWIKTNADGSGYDDSATASLGVDLSDWYSLRVHMFPVHRSTYNMVIRVYISDSKGSRRNVLSLYPGNHIFQYVQGRGGRDRTFINVVCNE